MSAETEMRRVIEHAADLLRARLDAAVPSGRTLYAPDIPPFRADNIAMAYAEGVLRLLASYLKVDEPPAPTPRRDERGRFLPGAVVVNHD